MAGVVTNQRQRKPVAKRVVKRVEVLGSDPFAALAAPEPDVVLGEAPRRKSRRPTTESRKPRPGNGKTAAETPAEAAAEKVVETAGDVETQAGAEAVAPADVAADAAGEMAAQADSGADVGTANAAPSDPFGLEPAAVARLAPILDFFLQSYFRCAIAGADNVPRAGRTLLVANHSGTFPFDGAMLMAAVRRVTNGERVLRPLGDDFAFRLPSVAAALARIGVVRANPENATRLLLGDAIVAVFPEGTKGLGKLYHDRYRLQRFGRGGFVKVAIQTATPVIPVAIVGAEEAHPLLAQVPWLAKTLRVPYFPVTPTFPWLGPLGMLPIPTKFFIEFGEPIVFEHAPPPAEPALDLIAPLAERVRQRVQEMIDGILARRKSILFG